MTSITWESLPRSAPPLDHVALTAGDPTSESVYVKGTLEVPFDTVAGLTGLNVMVPPEVLVSVNCVSSSFITTSTSG